MRPKFAIVLTTLLSLSCTLLTEVGGDSTDWDWAYSIARAAVDEQYGEHWYVRSFGAEHLDITGNLYDGETFPEWHVYFSDGTDRLLWVFIHEDGQFGIFELDTSDHTYDPLSSTYDSTYVRSWLRTSSNAYREITGRTDDVCYELYCSSSIYDRVNILLLNEDLDEVGHVLLKAWNSQIEVFWF